MEARRNFALAPALHVFVVPEQGVFQHCFLTRHGIEGGIGAGLDEDVILPSDQRIELDRAAVSRLGHAVIGHDDEIGGLAQRAQACDKRGDVLVDIGNGFVDDFAIGPAGVACRVHLVKIEEQQFGADIRRAAQPVDDRVDALRRRDVLVERRPVLRANAALDPAVSAGDRRAAPRHGRAGPEHGGRADAGVFGSHPDRLAPVPVERIGGRHGELLVRPARVGEAVGDDPVAIGNEAGDGRPVVGERLAREGWPHGGRNAARRERGQGRCQAAVQIVGPEPVD